MIVLSNLLSWVPASIVHLSSLFKIRYSDLLAIWTTIVLPSLNSVINPVLFVVAVLRAHKSWHGQYFWVFWAEWLCCFDWLPSRHTCEFRIIALFNRLGKQNLECILTSELLVLFPSAVIKWFCVQICILRFVPQETTPPSRNNAPFLFHQELLTRCWMTSLCESSSEERAEKRSQTAGKKKRERERERERRETEREGKREGRETEKERERESERRLS